MEKKSSGKGLGCLTLFALPFAAIGLFTAYLAGSMVLDWARMKAWEEVPARVVAVELESRRSSDSTSYRVVARYLYRVAGRDYTGTRVAVYDGSIGFEDYVKGIYAELSSHRSSGEPVPCFVNPDRPSESVLYRELHWGALGLFAVFVVAFGGMGFGLIALGVRGARLARRQDALEASAPDQPWLHKEEWRSGRIHSSMKATFVLSGVMALFWNAVSAPLVFVVPRELEKGNQAALIGLVFPLVGIGLAIWAARSFLQYRKFGKSVLVLRSLPGILGGPLEGQVETGIAMRPEGSFRLTLSSVRRVRSGSGKNRSTHESVLWQKVQELDVEGRYTAEGTAIPVSFAIPFSCLPTDETNPDNRVVWRLSVEAEIPGVDYQAFFEVPVFRTEKSSKDYVHDDSAVVSLRRPLDLTARLRRAGIRTELLPAGTRFDFPMARHVGMAFGTTLFFAAWTAIVAVLHYSDAPRIFPWIFGLFDLLIALGVLDLWFHKSSIEARPGELLFSTGLFGMGRRRKLTASELKEVTSARGMQSGSKLFYQLKVTTRERRSFTAAKRLPDLDTADELAREIERIVRA